MNAQRKFDCEQTIIIYFLNVRKAEIKVWSKRAL
jgi:hypothetical protein